jgi:hypothetical protein
MADRAKAKRPVTLGIQLFVCGGYGPSRATRLGLHCLKVTVSVIIRLDIRRMALYAFEVRSIALC